MCFCGASTCQGFIGWKQGSTKNGAGHAKTAPTSSIPASSFHMPTSNLLTGASSSAAARDSTREEDVCFLCLDDDNEPLLVCQGYLSRDVACAKVFHAACLYLGRAPNGRFQCPWHTCDHCAKRGRCVTHCIACTSSWCKNHTPAVYASDEYLQFVVGDDMNPTTRFVICSHCDIDVCKSMFCSHFDVLIFHSAALSDPSKSDSFNHDDAIVSPLPTLCFCLPQLQITVGALHAQQPVPKNILAVPSAPAQTMSSTMADSKSDLSFLLQSLDWIPGIRVSTSCHFPLLIATAAEHESLLHWNWPLAAAFIEQHRHLYAASPISLLAMPISTQESIDASDCNILDTSTESQTQDTSRSFIAKHGSRGGRTKEHVCDKFARGFPVTVVLDSGQESTPSIIQSPLFTRFVSEATPELAASTLSAHREKIHQGVDIATWEWDMEEF